MEIHFFETQSHFRQWLEAHHETEKEIVVGYYKLKTGKPSITWSQSVDQALCFGWIDGIRKSVDKDSYCIRFTPRRSKSQWSAVNIKKVEQLSKAGIMKPAGIKAFKDWYENQSHAYSYEKTQSMLSQEFEQQFREHQAAWDFFTKQAPSWQKAVIHWIMSAKQEKTRLGRLEKVITQSALQKRIT